MAFHNAPLPGELIERIDGDVAVLATFFSRFTLQVLASLLLLFGALLILVRLDWRIGLAFAGYAACGLVLLYSIRTVAVPSFEANRETSAALFGCLEERLAGTEDVRSRGATDYILRGLSQKMRQRLRALRRVSAMFSLGLGTMNLVLALGTAVAFVVSGSLYLAHALSLGTVYFAVSYSWMVAQPLNQLSQQLGTLQGALASIRRVENLLATTSTVDERGDVPLPEGCAGRLPHPAVFCRVQRVGAPKVLPRWNLYDVSGRCCGFHPSFTLGPHAAVDAAREHLLTRQMPSDVRHALPACVQRRCCERPLAIPPPYLRQGMSIHAAGCLCGMCKQPTAVGLSTSCTVGAAVVHP